MLEVVEILSGVIGIVTALGIFITKRIISPIKKIGSNIKENAVSIVEAQVLLKEMSETLNVHSDVLKELKPNGGGSIKDQIKKIADNLNNVHLTIDHLIKFSHTQLDLVPYAIWQSDSEGKNIFVNEAYKELFEVDSESVKDYKWMSLIHVNDVDTYVDLWNKTLNYKTDVTTTTRIVTYRTNTIIRCKVYWKVTLSADGNINYITGKIKPLNSDYAGK
jgi:PAS domain-containing protein